MISASVVVVVDVDVDAPVGSSVVGSSAVGCPSASNSAAISSAESRRPVSGVDHRLAVGSDGSAGQGRVGHGRTVGQRHTGHDRARERRRRRRGRRGAFSCDLGGAESRRRGVGRDEVIGRGGRGDLDRDGVTTVGDEHDTGGGARHLGDLADETRLVHHRHADLDAAGAALVDLDHLIEIVRRVADDTCHLGVDPRQRRKAVQRLQFLAFDHRCLGGRLRADQTIDLVLQREVLALEVVADRDACSGSGR
jgi:hypothetical protein